MKIRIWFVFGALAGGLLVWLFTREAHEAWVKKQEMERKLAPMTNAMRMEMAMEGAIDGIDYLNDDEWWEQELAQYDDIDDKEDYDDDAAFA